jgi:hypothetical protein
VQLLLPLRGQGMQPDAEQRLHLLRCHRITNLQTVDASQPGTNPHARAFTALGVVAGEWYVALLGRIQGRHLPRQIVVPRPRGQLVDAHRHASQKDGQPSPAVTSSAVRPGMKEVCGTSDREIGWGYVKQVEIVVMTARRAGRCLGLSEGAKWIGRR